MSIFLITAIISCNNYDYLLKNAKSLNFEVKMVCQMNHIHSPYKQNVRWLDIGEGVLEFMNFEGVVKCKYD